MLRNGSIHTRYTVFAFASSFRPVDIFTIRERSLRRLCFYACLSFCPLGVGVPRPRPRGGSGRGGVQAHTRGGGWRSGRGGVPRPIPRGVVGGPGWRGGLGPGPGGCPGPGLAVVCVSQHALRQTSPPHRRLLLRAVRILLECILV